MLTLIIFALVLIPIIGILAWVVFDEAFVRVEPGQLGLVLVRGRATDKALAPGPHFVPLMRRMQIVKYPSLEMAYRAGDPSESGEQERSLQQAGPSFRVVLGDRATVEVSYTVRFRLAPASLKSVHERFGKDGIWSAVRDSGNRAVRACLGDPAVGIADLLGDGRRVLEGRLAVAVGEVLAADGFELALFTLEDTDLGRTGEVIQAAVRARYELEREHAERATRVAEVQSDAALGEHLGADGAAVALRYRELGVWREIITTPAGGSAMAVAARPSVGAPPAHDEEGAGAESSPVRRAVSSTDRARTTHLDRVIEVVAVVLLAVATLGSAWCGYQASRWNGKETDHAREATDPRVEASREFGLASQRVSYDSTMAAEYAQAYVAGDQKLLTFYRATLVRPDFLPVLDRWQAEMAAGQTPENLTQDSDYLDQQLATYNELEARAEADTVASDRAGQESDDYVLTTVLLASALFFAGVTTSFRVRLPRLLLLAASGIIIAFAAARLTTLHVT